MNGSSHRFVVNLSLACLERDERYILFPRWGGLETGATLSDEHRIMWEPESLDKKNKQLVHRYFVDSPNSKDHGGVTRVWNHASGSIGFIESYLEDPNDGSYTEDEFLENLGMFFGIISHHIADICTPVHVGHKMNYLKAKSRNRVSFHRKVERDIDRFARKVPLQMYKPKTVKLSEEFFKRIATETYNTMFLNLENIYSTSATDDIQEMVSQVISSSVKNTADVWHSILRSTAILNRKWSMQTLI